MVLSMSFHLLLPRQIYNQMLQQAQAELPNECCGLLAAKGVEGEQLIVRVEKAYPLINIADTSGVEYLSDPRSMFDAMRDMRKHELDLVATYHSHPTSPPIPSKTDLARNYSEAVVNFIISLQKSEPQVRGWWLTATDYREASWEIVDE